MAGTDLREAITNAMLPVCTEWGPIDLNESALDLLVDMIVPAVEARIAAAQLTIPQPVIDFINERPTFILEMRHITMSGAGPDYHRNSGHAQARTQLAHQLGLTSPSAVGDTTKPVQ